MSLDEAFQSPHAKRGYVRRLFATIADRYDLITAVLSYGQDARWKKRLVSIAAVRPGERALDLAAGTGSSSLPFAAATLIMDTIERVGPDRKKLRDALNKTRDADTIIGKVTFDDHRQNIVPLISKYVVQDNKWVLWEDSEYATKKRKLIGQ